MKVGLARTGSIVRVGLRAIVRNKLRSFLTMLLIVIGVACVIAMNAVGKGASRSIQENISALGTNYIMIFPGATTQSGARIFTGQSQLRAEDVAAIREECPSVAYVSAGARTGGQVVAGELNWSTQIFGADVDWIFIRAWNVEEGSFFTEAEVRAAAQVAVLGATVDEALFPDGGAVGSTIRVRNVPFRVVGVLERKGGNTMGADQDDQVVAPYTTVMKRLEGRDRIGIIQVSARSPELVGQAMSEIDALLRQRLRVPPNGDAPFSMRSQEEIASQAGEMSRTLSTLLASVAAISLIVGGIGIMTVMLVSVTERTREIGIRMAIGAKSRHVMAQFLLEAVTLSVVGGLLGVGVGVLVSRLIGKQQGWPIVIDMPSIGLAFGCAVAIGVFFGFWPARKAARLDPIEALRYE
jgi:putative ABC transport system permease protein